MPPLRHRIGRPAAVTLAASTALVAIAGWCSARNLPALPEPPKRSPGPGWSSHPAPRTSTIGPDTRRVDPTTASPAAAAFERGLAAYNADDLDAAADAFEEAVRLAPADAEARINLGFVYLRLRRADDGLRELREGARLEQQQGGAATSARPDVTIRKHARP